MKNTILLFLCICLSMVCRAQEPADNSSTKRDSTAGLHLEAPIQSKKIELIKRENYAYYLQFELDERGPLARMFSEGGVEFNLQDEVIFMNESRERVVVEFIEDREPATDPNVRDFENVLWLDPYAMDWMTWSTVTTVYIKNNVNNQIRKVALDESVQVALKELANKFYKENSEQIKKFW